MILSGLVWLLGSFVLLSLGTKLMIKAALVGPAALLPTLSPILGLTQSMIGLTLFALILGYLKSSFIITKTVRRETSRILALAKPSISNLFSRKHLVIVAFMMGLSYLFKVIELSVDIRAVIDIAVGSALLQGALAYFFSAQKAKHS